MSAMAAALNLSSTGVYHSGGSRSGKTVFEHCPMRHAPQGLPRAGCCRNLPVLQALLAADSICGSSFTRGARSSSRRRRSDSRRHARFQQFSPPDEPEALEDLPDLVESDESSSEEEDDGDDERPDRVLPESLEGTISQASESAALFVTAGGDRAVVELFIPQLQNMGEEGDQQRLWNLSRQFLEDLQSRLGSQQLKAVFPDAGVAAMIQHHWKGSPFTFASLNDRKPITANDEVVVLIQPDYQMLSSVEKIASALRGDDDGAPRPLIMYNPSLQSGEVGIGLNVRRMRENFLSTFNPVYSMRALQYGAVFRRYPGPWQVFFDDEQAPGRYLLASETPGRPNLEDIEELFMRKNKDGEEGDNEPGPLDNLRNVLSSMNRFMQSLSR